MKKYKKILSEIDELQEQLWRAWTEERELSIVKIKELMKELNISIPDLNGTFDNGDCKNYIKNGAKKNTSLKFIDLFAGCGGLSLGLITAGCKGVFAVEKSPLAFSTLKHNLIDNKKHCF